MGLSSSQSQTGFALILGEHRGVRRLPIIIGIFEAQAIAIEIEKITPHRPMTHDLFKSFANAFHYKINEILISDLKEGVFYAKIICSSKDGQIFEIDSRPSDAIAIGVRFNVPIFVEEHIISEAGIIVSEEEMEEPEIENREVHQTSTDNNTQYSLEELQEMLNKALEKEDYEEAARIRDEINKRN